MPYQFVTEWAKAGGVPQLWLTCEKEPWVPVHPVGRPVALSSKPGLTTRFCAIAPVTDTAARAIKTSFLIKSSPNSCDVGLSITKSGSTTRSPPEVQSLYRILRCIERTLFKPGNFSLSLAQTCQELNEKRNPTICSECG